VISSKEVQHIRQHRPHFEQRIDTPAVVKQASPED